jgi:AhpD family alkylhydroperoxidase
MEARMINPAMVVPGSFEAIKSLIAAVKAVGVSESTLELVHLRASQINGCGFCLDLSAKGAKKSGESIERLFTVAGWRDAPYFTDAERAALALAEGMTRLSDRSDPVSDEVWTEVARHYDEAQLGTLVIYIGLVNLFNRVNVTTRQVAGRWAG